MLLRHTLLLSLLLLGGLLHAQCNLADIEATISGCDANDNVTVRIKFFDTDIDIKTYIVQGNGVNYGTFSYGNGIEIIDIAGNCTTPYEFVVRDTANPNCAINIEVGKICCGPCLLKAEVVSFTDCDADDVYTATFSITDPPANSNGYEVFIDGVLIDFNLYAGAEQDTKIQHDGSDIETIVICDRSDPTCCDSITYVPPCVCDITNMRWDVIECDEVDSTFYFIFDVDYQAVSDSFTMGGNATNYGNFAYSQLPITLGPFDWSDIKYDFVLADLNNLFCFDFVEPGTIELCPEECDFGNTFMDYVCNGDDDLEVTINIDNPGIGINGYEVFVDGILLDTLYDATTTYTYTVKHGYCGIAPQLVLNDLFYSCDTSITLVDVCCNPPCTISDFAVSVDCMTGDATVSLTTDADTGEPVTMRLLGNGVDQDFTGLTVADFPFVFDISNLANGTFVLEIFIDSDLCSSEDQLDIDCTSACILGPLVLNIGTCQPNGMVEISIDFSATDTPSDMFELTGNMGLSFGTFTYNQGPYVIMVPGDCTTIYEFVTSDIDDPSCGTSAGLGGPICCVCDNAITDIHVGDCDGEQVEITISVQGNAAAAGSYSLSGNGSNYGTFNYNDGSATVMVDGDCTTLYDFVITDVDDPSCMDTEGLDMPICCLIDTCTLDIAVASTSPCDGDSVSVTLVIAASTTSDSFDLRGNGTEYGTFSYGQSPVTVMVLGDCTTIYEFIALDSDDTGCSAATGLSDVLCCTADICGIEITSVSVGDCNADDEVEVIISVSGVATSDSFDLSGNGTAYGTYAYTDGPVVLVLAADCQSIDEFVVVDGDDPSCTDAFGLGMPLCCTAPACSNEIVSIEIGDCTEGDSVQLAIFVEGNMAASASFNLTVTGAGFGNYTYAESPIFVWVLADCSTIYQFVIVDNDDFGCTDVAALAQPLCCDSIDCDIAITEVEVGACMGDSVLVSLAVEDNTSQGSTFTLSGNGANYGTFAYADSVIQVTVLADCATLYEFVMVDSDHPDCTAMSTLSEPICCSPDDCSIEIAGFSLGDCMSDSIVVSLSIDANGAASTTFTLAGNGTNYGTFAYADSIVEVALLADCTTLYEFVIVDGANNGCVDVLDFVEPLCCDTDTTCSLTAFDIETGPCVDGLYSVTFDILGSNLSDEIDVLVDGRLSTTLTTTAGPFTIDNLPGGDTIIITVVDAELGCSDNFVVLQDCTTSTTASIAAATKIYSAGSTIIIESANIWWDHAVAYTIDGKRLYEGDLKDARIDINGYDGIVITRLSNEHTAITEKVWIGR